MKAGDIMGWKKKLGFITACAGITTATMHVINRVFSYIATADDLFNSTTGDLGKLRIKKQVMVLPYF